MGTSLKVGGAIITAMIAAVSFAFNTFNIIPNAPWSLIAFISFLFFVAFVFWGWNGAEKHVRQLEATKPSIIVQDFGFNLMVRNIGASATFTVNIRITKDYMGYVDNKPYAGYWEKTKSYKTEIMKTNFDNIVIAACEHKPTNPPVMNLRLYYYDFNSGSVNSLQSGGWFWTPKDQKERPLYPEYELEITISSKPEMPKIYTEWYKLDLDGLHFIERRELTGK